MKSTQSILSQFETTAGIWLASLSQYSEEQFARKPDENSWSIGQVYNHLVTGTRLYQLQQVARCLEGKKNEKNAGKKLPGKLTFLLGSFPPLRIKVPPSEIYTPKQPSNIETMKTGLEKLITIMRETERKLAGASAISKTSHPAFGFLNAQEWFHLIEMHFRHHLHQKKRLDRFLAQS
jgi:hypothetical protein